MSQIRSMLGEVRYELLKVILLNTFLEAAIVFLATHLVLSIFSMPLLYSGLIAAAYFGYRFWRKSREFDLKRIEERNPSIKEMLRTANDNMDNDSLMAQALFGEVLAKVRRISSGTLLDLGVILKRLTTIFLLSVVLVGLAFFNIDIGAFENPLSGAAAGVGDFFERVTGASPEQEEVALDDEDMYGDASMAQLGDDQVRFDVRPSMTQMDFSDPQDPDLSTGSIKDYPGEADAMRDESYTGGLEDVNDRKAAADYSQQVNQ